MKLKETLNADLGFTPTGTFFGKLNRVNSKIKQDRAIAIAESAERIFKRSIEDMLDKKKELLRLREGMLDLSPTSADSLVLANDFDATKFFQDDLKIGERLREIDIRLEIAVERFNELFEDSDEEPTPDAESKEVTE